MPAQEHATVQVEAIHRISVSSNDSAHNKIPMRIFEPDQAGSIILVTRLCLRVSHDSEAVHEPPYLSVVVAASEVVTHQKLVDEDCCEQLCSIVVQTPMPHASFQFEQRFEP